MIKLDLTNLEKAPPDWSEIFDYREDIGKLKTQLKEFEGVKKIILVGNGGSINSYNAYYGALRPKVDSSTVCTMEPDFLKMVKSESPQKDTVVVTVSKSGTNLGQLESTLYFKDYRVVAVTDPDKGTLSEIAKKMGWKIILHPPIGGRFSGGTSCAFAPAILAGLDVGEIQKGIEAGHELKDEAYTFSKYLFNLEQKGYNEVYLSLYDVCLDGFRNLIIQLMHESVCKEGQGQTFYASLSPESQHHTNQRFLGGKKNVIGLFMIVRDANDPQNIEIPNNLKDVKYKDVTLGALNGIGYQQALYSEYLGTKSDADEKNIPNVTLEIDKVTSQSVGELLGFWHLVAFYSAILRGVNPFDQPAVERSKEIALKEVLKNSGR